MKENSIIISIIIPVYNLEKYIRTCLQSLIEQTYKDFEVIIIDDGSTDNSYEICTEYKKCFRNMKIIRKSNGGLSDARNSGIEAATGSYIIFLDGDDWIDDKDTIKSMVKIVNNNYPDVVLNLFKYCNDGDDNVTKCGYTFDGVTKQQNPIYMFKEITQLKGICLGAPVFAINRHFLINNNLFFTKGICHEDLLWDIELFMKCNTLIFSDIYIFCYRLSRTGSIMNSITSKNIEDLLYIIDKIQNEKLEYPLKVQKVADYWIGQIYKITIKFLVNIDINTLSDDLIQDIESRRKLIKINTFKDFTLKIIISLLGVNKTVKIIRKLKGSIYN